MLDCRVAHRQNHVKEHHVQTELLKVTGMTCGGCISNVTHALKAITGVGDVKVSPANG
ncbi:MAG: heavy-metal-associated domain-containing protein [Herminiimonas sp.]|nr:heavy-metal-associated domain-containing protein [Herminiimonas sp.]